MNDQMQTTEGALVPEDGVITPDEIVALHNAIMEKTEDGTSAGLVKVTIDQVHNVTAETFNDARPEDIEGLFELNLENVGVDMYTRDILGRKWYVAITFDTEFSQEKKDLLEIMQKYEKLCETKETEESLGINSPIPVFGILFVPYSLDGNYYAHFAFPEEAEIIDEKAVSFLFDFDNMDYVKSEIDDNERAEIQADIMREFEEKGEYGASTGMGGIFEEEEGAE